MSEETKQPIDQIIPRFCLGEAYSAELYRLCKRIDNEVGLMNGATALYWSLMPIFETHIKKL